MSDRNKISPLSSLHLHTEFLESCGWDEEKCDTLLNQISDIFNDLEINKSQIVIFGFDKWFELKVVSKFMDLGLDEIQINILKRLVNIVAANTKYDGDE